MSANADLIKRIKDEEIDYVDIRFTDPRGKLQHVTIVNDLVDLSLTTICRRRKRRK